MASSSLYVLTAIPHDTEEPKRIEAPIEHQLLMAPLETSDATGDNSSYNRSNVSVDVDCCSSFLSCLTAVVGCIPIL